MNDSTAVILKTAIDYGKPSLIVETNWYFVAGLLLLVLIYFIYRRKIKAKLKNAFVGDTNISINTGLFSYNQNIKRCY